MDSEDCGSPNVMVSVDRNLGGEKAISSLRPNGKLPAVNAPGERNLLGSPLPVR